jgi:hypothetical protein
VLVRRIVLAVGVSCAGLFPAVAQQQAVSPVHAGTDPLVAIPEELFRVAFLRRGRLGVQRSWREKGSMWWASFSRPMPNDSGAFIVMLVSYPTAGCWEFNVQLSQNKVGNRTRVSLTATERDLNAEAGLRSAYRWASSSPLQCSRCSHACPSPKPKRPLSVTIANVAKSARADDGDVWPARTF